MSKITAEIYLDFETDAPITPEMFKKFKLAIEKLISGDVEMMVYDTANDCGFEVDSFHPITVDNFDCEYEGEE